MGIGCDTEKTSTGEPIILEKLNEIIEWKISKDLCGQHYISVLCQKIREHNFLKTSGNCKTTLETLFGHKHPPSDRICLISSKPSECTKQAHSSNRMVAFRKSVQGSGDDIRAPQRGIVCGKQKQESISILQLVHGQEINRAECLDVQLSKVEQPILLPSLEPYTQGNPETNKRQATEDQRRFFKTQGLNNYAIEIITANKRRTRRRSIYNSIQQEYVNWRTEMSYTGPVLASEIINFLAKIATERNLKSGSIIAYKSAILGLLENAEKILMNKMFKEFIAALNDSFNKSIEKLGTLRVITKRQINSQDLLVIAVTGFLQASDIHRIDDARSRIENNTLHLVIVAPKEKRAGKPIERPC
ncbi:hypothetical protein BB561_001219 [Smittium simulii]|uniref:Uncharacterized protein n=1 Tax=Smittium simulii TaxID=133385 RepID=A0A2T9YVR9_9FUNG|nr:hypothetical protein BB561_001219 [Smittium simulii]